MTTHYPRGEGRAERGLVEPPAHLVGRQLDARLDVGAGQLRPQELEQVCDDAVEVHPAALKAQRPREVHDLFDRL